MKKPDRKPDGKCFAKNCADCNWWRYKQRQKYQNGMPIGITAMKWICEFESLFAFLPQLAGCIDGAQAAANRSENTIIKFVAGVKETFKNDKKQLKG